MRAAVDTSDKVPFLNIPFSKNNNSYFQLRHNGISSFS